MLVTSGADEDVREIDNGNAGIGAATSRTLNTAVATRSRENDRIVLALDDHPRHSKRNSNAMRCAVICSRSVCMCSCRPQVAWAFFDLIDDYAEQTNRRHH
eukprot:scaffold206009_cov35-Prasinocladus_malaysianus.AAC.1